jgi:hypothetical protein
MRDMISHHIHPTRTTRHGETILAPDTRCSLSRHPCSGFDKPAESIRNPCRSDVEVEQQAQVRSHPVRVMSGKLASRMFAVADVAEPASVGVTSNGWFDH